MNCSTVQRLIKYNLSISVCGGPPTPIGNVTYGSVPMLLREKIFSKSEIFRQKYVFMFCFFHFYKRSADLK